MKKNMLRRHNSALISVLCLVFTAGILTAAVLSLSKSGTFTVTTHVDLQRSMLIAEGVANRVQWLMAADRNLNPNDKPGTVDYTTFEYDRFMADGVKHTLEYYGETVQVQVVDAVNGWDMGQSQYQSVLNMISGQEDAGEDVVDLCEEISQLIADYIDSDENIQERGMESADYEDAMKKPLPRNAAMQFREEFLYIRNFTELFPLDKDGRLSAVRLIPPANTSDLSGNPSLFTVTRKDVELNFPDLGEDEIDNIMQALKLWREDRELLSDNLDEDLYNQLTAKFSAVESGAYTVIISAPSDGVSRNRPFRKLIFSYAGFEVSGPPDKLLKYMEWNFL
ncbi:MAG: general secretion pathway protein GspK [Lentisphaeria bacterium]|nr:general secretion pathway protein GspK [Lentisphaeria bacterium]